MSIEPMYRISGEVDRVTGTVYDTYEDVPEDSSSWTATLPLQASASDIVSAAHDVAFGLEADWTDAQPMKIAAGVALFISSQLTDERPTVAEARDTARR